MFTCCSSFLDEYHISDTARDNENDLIKVDSVFLGTHFAEIKIMVPVTGRDGDLDVTIEISNVFTLSFQSDE